MDMPHIPIAWAVQSDMACPKPYEMMASAYLAVCHIYVAARCLVQVKERKRQPQTIETQQLDALEHCREVTERGIGIASPQAVYHAPTVVEAKPIHALRQTGAVKQVAGFSVFEASYRT